MDNPKLPQETIDLIAKLQSMHPEYVWGVYPLGDYDQYSIGNPPEMLICFSSDEVPTCEFITDAFSTFYGETCEPKHWKISTEAAQLLRDHNQIAVAGVS